MQNYVETVQTFPNSYANTLKSLLQIFVGSILLSLSAKIALPLSPVPLTMQTFAVMFLVLSLGKVKGTLSVLAYLLEGTIGLPVFSQALGAPLAIFGLRGGYLFGFVIQAYLVGCLFEKSSSYLTKLISLVLISALQLLCGTLWLGGFIGLQPALLAGFYPFIPGEIIKCVSLLALSSLHRK